MKEWIGHNLHKDHRVICHSTGKVYTSNEAAAFVLGLTSKDVYNCCERRIRTVGDGLRFDWYAQYCSETPFEEIIRPAKVIFVPFRKPDTLLSRFRAEKKGASPAEFTETILYHISAFRAFLDENNAWGISIPVERLRDAMKTWAKKEFDVDFKATSNSMAIYVKNHMILLEASLGARLTEIYSPKSKRMVTAVNFAGPREISEDIITLKDPRMYVSDSSTHSSPVVRMETQDVYGSMRKCSMYERFPEYMIRFCCDGDVPHLLRVGIPHTFRYVKWI